MTKIPDHIFEEAILRLEQGESAQHIASRFPDHSEELMGLLLLVELGKSIPKLTPPTPYRRRLYAEKAIINSGRFAQLFTFARAAIIPISLVIALLGGRAVVTATEDSLPGDTLYSLKRATEEARIGLTRDQAKLASIHVELMQKRLDEVKKAASSGNEASETAAIAELQSQTEKTFAEAAPVATANVLSKQDASLLNTLVAVNKEHKDVLAAVSENTEEQDAKIVVMTALEDTKKNDETIAKIIAVVNEQALADLPNKISVTGDVASYNSQRIIVERNTFAIDNATTFTGLDGLNIDSTTIAEAIAKARVTVTGTRLENGTLLAKQILMLPEEPAGEVKGETTTNTSTTTKPASTKPTTTTNTAPPSTPTEAPKVEEPPTAQGTYIVEPNTQQYAP